VHKETQPTWITAKEAQHLTSLGRTTLWRIANADEGVVTARIGRSLRFNRESLLAYMDHHTTQPRLPGFSDFQ
jgi:predicted DNA-binding transcriptional regulator AlpA